MNNEEKTAKGKIRDAFDKYVIFYLLAVIISLGGVFFVLPFMLVSVANKAVALVCCFFLIPLIRAVTESLINYQEFSLRFFFKQYLFALNFLIFGLLLVVFSIPVILSELMLILGGILVLVFIIFAGIGLLQHVFGISIGREIPLHEIVEALQYLAIAAVAEAVFVGLKIIRSRFDNDFFELWAYVYTTGSDWIERKL